MTPIGQLLVGVLPKGLRVPHRIPHEKGSGFGVWDVQDLFGEKGPGLWKVVFDSNVEKDVRTQLTEAFFYRMC